MEKRNIGKSGLSAPFLGLGTWAIGGGSWWGDNDDALSVKAIETAVEQGITWIDTAPIYGLYHSEEVVGEALRHIDRDKVILSTKCGLEWRHESPVLHKVVDGVQTYRDVIEAVPDQRPTSVLRTLDDFFAPYPEIEVLFEGYEVIATGPTWQARVRGENLILTGPENLDEGTFAGSESEAEAWRVAYAAWWAANPEQAAVPVIKGLPGA